MELRSSLDRQPLSLRDGAANADLPAAVRLSAIGREATAMGAAAR